MIDELYRWLIIVTGWILGSFLGTAGQGISLIIMFMTYWLFGVAFEVLNNGVTPGKKSLKLRVVHDDGTPIRLPASLVRNFLLTIDFLPVAYTAGIVSLLVTTPFRRIGDMAAGTMVVYDASVSQVSSDPDRAMKASPVVLQQEEQTFLVDYLERAQHLNAARADELAHILAEVLQTTPTNARREIEQVAAGYKGTTQSDHLHRDSLQGRTEQGSGL